jgi:hypothetical protein
MDSRFSIATTPMAIATTTVQRSSLFEEGSFEQRHSLFRAFSRSARGFQDEQNEGGGRLVRVLQPHLSLRTECGKRQPLLLRASAASLVALRCSQGIGAALSPGSLASRCCSTLAS